MGAFTMRVHVCWSRLGVNVWLVAALVPDSVKKELLQRIRAFLAQHAAL